MSIARITAPSYDYLHIREPLIYIVFISAVRVFCWLVHEDNMKKTDYTLWMYRKFRILDV